MPHIQFSHAPQTHILMNSLGRSHHLHPVSHSFYATFMEGGAADRRPRGPYDPCIYQYIYAYFCFDFFSHSRQESPFSFYMRNTPVIDCVLRACCSVSLARLMQELHFAEWEFSIYFVGYCNEADIPSDPKERTRWCFQQVRVAWQVGRSCVSYLPR